MATCRTCEKCGGDITLREKIEALVPARTTAGWDEFVSQVKKILLELETRVSSIEEKQSQPPYIFPLIPNPSPYPIPSGGGAIPWVPPIYPMPTTPSLPYPPSYPIITCKADGLLAQNNNNTNAVSDATGFVDTPLSRQESIARMTEVREDLETKARSFALSCEGLNGRMPTKL